MGEGGGGERDGMVDRIGKYKMREWPGGGEDERGGEEERGREGVGRRRRGGGGGGEGGRRGEGEGEGRRGRREGEGRRGEKGGEGGRRGEKGGEGGRRGENGRGRGEGEKRPSTYQELQFFQFSYFIGDGQQPVVTQVDREQVHMTQLAGDLGQEVSTTKKKWLCCNMCWQHWIATLDSNIG